MTLKCNQRLNNQEGAVLITGLLILVILTLLGLVAMQSSTLQEKMAFNMTNRNLAFQAAEAALREGEALLTGAVIPVFDGTDGLYQPPLVWQALNWNDGDSRRITDLADNPQDLIDGVAEPPRYVIEEMGPIASPAGSLLAGVPLSDHVMYRITARGVGGVASGAVVLQSTYLR